MKKSLVNKQIFSMLFAGILIALILLMTFIPQLGYITINAVPITIIHIPVIISGIILGRIRTYLRNCLWAWFDGA